MGEILCLNAGSSSLKFALFDGAAAVEPRLVAAGKIEKIGIAPHLIVRAAEGTVLAEQRWPAGGDMTHESLLADLLARIEGAARHDIVGVGHRIVHGGTAFFDPVLASGAVLAQLDALCPLAPLHQPHNLAAVRAVAAVRPALPQVLCFDTAFHHRQPAVATRFALPRALEDEGIRRYGFHGLSYAYIRRRLAEIDPFLVGERVIAAHLGNGASLCAIKEGQSIDTTMGFTALDGLVMGTRSGALDPGAVLYLFQQRGMTAREVEHLLYAESGLLGVSGLSSDMRALLASDDPRAAEAIDLFTYQVARQAGALAASLQGLDTFVFTAGIGENAPEIRARICDRLGWLGVRIDEEANRRGEPVISLPGSPVVVRIIPTDEERMIAIHSCDLLLKEGGRNGSSG